MMKRFRLNNDLCDGESGRCRAEIVEDPNGDLIDCKEGIPIEEIALEHISAGFGKSCVVVKAKVDGNWVELIRDREPSSNNHSISAHVIRKLTEAGNAKPI